MTQELTLEQAFNNLHQAVSLAKFTLAEGEIVKQSFRLVGEKLFDKQNKIPQEELIK